MTIIVKSKDGKDVEVNREEIYNALEKMCELTEIRLNEFVSSNGTLYKLTKMGFVRLDYRSF